jgi:hypothetical protein
MKKHLLILAIAFLLVGFFGHAALAHPGTGIVIDKYGNIYFIYTGVGVAKISGDGKLIYIHKATDGHWICLDQEGFFSQTQPKYFERITPDGTKPAIIYAGGGSPIIVNKDGNFYYCGSQNGDMHPGGMTLIRETPGKRQTIFAPTLENRLNKLEDGITGIAAGPDGSLYAACWNSLIKITLDGVVTTLVHPVIIRDCDQDPADHRNVNRGKPLLRGIDVDSNGTIYTAATSCHCVVKIDSNGKIKTILKAQRPWSPTGVTVRDGNVYVLEYTNANGPAEEGWFPRIRKIAKDGKITTIIDLSSRKK